MLRIRRSQHFDGVSVSAVHFPGVDQWRVAVITESGRDLLQIVARPGTGAAYRLQRPLHELVGLPGQLNRWRFVRGPIRQHRVHVAAVFRKRSLNIIESFRCHSLAKFVGGFVDCGFAAHRGCLNHPQNCDCLGRYMDWNKPVKYESCCSIWAIDASAAAILACSELCSWLILSCWSEIN